jgi:predicted transcriptional regulator
MSTVTVNISFQDALLADIDATARREARSRSELLREAARLYVRRQKQWDDVFALGDRQVARLGLTATNLSQEIRATRKNRRRSS